MGSPPHTRGILKKVQKEVKQKGFTPAYAGNTNEFLFQSVGNWVHPRIRGEYKSTPREVPPYRGSPPHTRGILVTSTGVLIVIRFTPAYAGNTSASPPMSCIRWVHPRIRGEYFLRTQPDLSAMGSPPHTRGIPGFDGVRSLGCRFTPAYAGNTRSDALLTGQ